LNVNNDPETQTSARAESIASPPRSYRILVVDDNPDAAEIMAMLLSASGHQVYCAADGPSALEAAREHAPEVVLLDIGLPGMNGYELATRLRELALPHRPHLVAITGYDEEEDRARSRAAGIDQHIVKPVEHKVLTRVLRAVEESAPPRAAR
jgi:two-component system CheB/CheR fusion protein